MGHPKLKRPVSIRFRVDANETLGLGHLSRCRSLMLAFKKVDPSCRFDIVTKTKEVVQQFITDIEADIGSPPEHPWTGWHADMMIVDVPGIADENDAMTEASGSLLVCIDDEGLGLERQDVLICPNLLNLPQPASTGQAYYWSGRDYIVLHPDFASRIVRRRGRSVRELLVCFGGSDPAKVTLRVIPLLKKLCSDMKVNVVLGAAFTHSNEVLRLVEGDERFHVNINAVGMAKHFFHADAAFISGGTLLYEACASGVPAAIVSQNNAQAVEAGICHRAGAVMDLGIHDEIADEAIAVSLSRILTDSNLRKDMSQRAVKLVTPNGAERIASRLLKLIGKEAK